MKPLDRPLLTVHAGPLRLYRKDLDFVLAVLSQAPGASIRIWDDEHEYESLDDLQRNLGNVIDHIFIEAQGRDLELYFRNGGTWSGYANGRDLWPFLAEIENYFKRNRLYRLGADLSRGPILSIPAVMLGAAVGIMIADMRVPGTIWKLAIPFVAMAAISLARMAIKPFLIGHRLVLTAQHEYVPWWKGSIAVEALKALVSALIGAAVGYIVGRS